MNLKTQKRIASELLKCGASRVRVKPEKEVADALTRNDVQMLIRKGLIYKEQKAGTSKAKSKKIREQKKKGRQVGRGSRKGTLNARKHSKEKWIGVIRPLRKVLKEMKDSGQIDTATYQKMYMRAKGGFFRNKKHIISHLRENELLKKSKKEAFDELKKKGKKVAASKKSAVKKTVKKKATKPKKSEKK